MTRIGCIISPEDYMPAAQAGYDFIELSGRNVCKMEQADFQNLLTLVHGGTLPCVGFNAYCTPDIKIAGPGFSEEMIRQYANLCCERAEMLGVSLIGIGSPFSRMLPEGFSRQRANGQAVSFYQITADVFRGAGITVCVEALAGCYCNFINTVEEAAEIVWLSGRPNLKMVIDFYNMEHEREADIDLSPYLDQIAHVHISDDAGSPQKRWFLKESKLLVHQDRVRRLIHAGYRCDISLEVDLPLTLKEASQSLETLRTAVS